MISFYAGFGKGKWKLSFLLQLSNVLLKWAYCRMSQSTMVFEIKFDKPCKKSAISKFNGDDASYADERESGGDDDDDDEQVNRLTEDLSKLELI